MIQEEIELPLGSCSVDVVRFLRFDQPDCVIEKPPRCLIFDLVKEVEHLASLAGHYLLRDLVPAEHLP
jgi:hypothetical protein